MRASGLSLRLGTQLVLEDLALEVPRGSFCAVLGPNGGGKSSLLKLILGLHQQDSGSLEVFGEPAPARHVRIGYVPQAKTLDRSFPAQALELVVSGLSRSWPWRISPSQRQAAMQALQQAGALELSERQISVLSGGELQRVYLARALARQPELILLDEPAAGIDAAGEHDMYHVLESWQHASGATVLMVTHDWGAAFHHASLALVLSRRLLASGPPQQVLSDETLRLAFGHHGHSHSMSWHAPHSHPPHNPAPRPPEAPHA
ncbi:ABC transporter ATP-binding protein [bacterium]|nr:ABC transporter ATP-binding protein [bacterium]